MLRKPEATPRESCRFQIVMFDCTIKIKLPGSETMEQNEGKPGERNPGIKDMLVETLATPRDLCS